MPSCLRDSTLLHSGRLPGRGSTASGRREVRLVARDCHAAQRPLEWVKAKVRGTLETENDSAAPARQIADHIAPPLPGLALPALRSADIAPRRAGVLRDGG